MISLCASEDLNSSVSLPRQPSSLIASGIGGVPGVQDYSYKYIFSCCARGWQMQSIGSLCPAGARCTREWGMLDRWTSKHITKNKITSLNLAGRQEINILVCRETQWCPYHICLRNMPMVFLPIDISGNWMLALPLDDKPAPACSHPGEGLSLLSLRKRSWTLDYQREGTVPMPNPLEYGGKVTESQLGSWISGPAHWPTQYLGPLQAA